MKLYAIGDVHGCFLTLEALLAEIYLDIGSDEATIVFLGDYVDRGPRSAQVVDFLANLVDTDKIKYIKLLGNHEEMILDLIEHKDDSWQAYQKSTIESYKALGIGPKDHLAFFKSLKRYWRYGEFCFVHANLPPDKTFAAAVGLPTYRSHDILIWGREYNFFDGKFPDDVFVIHGHTQTPTVMQRFNQISIDTGCCNEKYGNLTGIRIDSRTQFKFFTIKNID